MKKVSILGCGWVGKVLKDTLEVDYEVVCLSRDIVYNHQAKMYACDSLVIAIPPRDNYLEVLKETLEKVAVDTQVVFVSSISFYDGKTLVVEAEKLVQSMHEKAVILRLGGLMGYERIAGRYTAGKSMAYDSRTNYVHRDDVVAIICTIINCKIINDMFDVVAPVQSTKKVIFDQNAKRFGFEQTRFLNGYNEVKRLDPSKLIKILDYEFIRKDVNKFWDNDNIKDFERSTNMLQ